MTHDDDKPFKPLGQDFAHLFLNGPGQSAEWKARESARRKGRGNKNWHLQCPMKQDPPYGRQDAGAQFDRLNFQPVEYIDKKGERRREAGEEPTSGA